MSHRLLFCLLLAGLALAPLCVEATKVPLRASVRQVIARGRNAAPVEFEVTLRWDGSHLLEGCLEFAVRDNDTVLGTSRSEPLALTAGERAYRALLLPSAREPYNRQAEVELRFVTTETTIGLGRFALNYAAPTERQLVMGVIEGPAGTAGEPSELLLNLRLNPFMPEDKSRRMTLSTVIARLTPEELSTDPLNLCLYDVLVLQPTGWTALREKQLAAVRRWVRGGGSVCVFPGLADKPYHAQFLRDLAADATDAVPARSPTAGDASDIQLSRVGLGRAVVMTTAAQDTATCASAAWRRAVCFLWKVRADQTESVLRTGYWEPPSDKDSDRYDPYNALSFAPRNMAPYEAMTFIPGLLPEALSVMPFGITVLLLVLFTLAIGPGDYYLLGWLRRQRWTWVLFPALCVGFTALTVLLARHYLGTKDSRRALIIVDVDERGETLRSTRIEVILAAGNKPVTTPVRHAWFAPVAQQDMQEMYYGRRYRGGDAGEPGLPECSGRPPVSYDVVQNLRQWTPQINRTLSFDAAPPAPGPDWTAVEAVAMPYWAKLAKSKEAVDVPGPGIAQAESPRHRASRLLLLWRDGNSLSPFYDEGRNGIRLVPGLDAQTVGNVGRSLTTIHVPRGLFSVVSQVSPLAAPSLEDLAFGDPSDPTERVVVVVSRQGDDYVAYRRLWRGDSEFPHDPRGEKSNSGL